ncbi:hypothetical protein Avbf_19195, partial [Armadillidium vulgare]
MARAITLGLSSAYGYVELSDEEMFLERTARPITPTHSMVYFQPLPDVVSNYWRPNPAFQDMPGIPSSPSGESRDRVSKLVDKISSCFARRKSESTSLVTADHSDDASNEHNNRVLHDRLVGEELDRQELQVQEVRARRIHRGVRWPEGGGSEDGSRSNGKRNNWSSIKTDWRHFSRISSGNYYYCYYYNY